MQEIAPGVFVRQGVDAEATAANRDAIANTGFIVGGRSVLVTIPAAAWPTAGGCGAKSASVPTSRSATW